MKNNIYSFFIFLIAIVGNIEAQQDRTVIRQDAFTYEEIAITDSKEQNTLLENAPSVSKVISKNISSGIGETEGQLSVSLTGGAKYSVPIKVPNGLNGVTPQISISYNSQNGNGNVGYGWEIAGISSISRVPSTKYHDNLIDAVNLDNSDRFALDGQRLILKSGTYGGDGAVYETENYSNIKVTSIGTTSDGPDYFKVNYPDGSVAYYGNSTNSKSIISYSITSWENSQGVSIDYFYVDNSFQNKIIEKITYGSLDSSTHPYEIRFDFNYNTGRKRYEQAYVGHNLVKNRSLLENILVFSSNNLLKRYELNNSNVTNLNYNRLTSITEYSGDGSQSHSPIVFDYDNSSVGVNTNDFTATLNLLNIEQRNAQTISLDLTGNGKMDFVVTPLDDVDKDKFWVFSDIQDSQNNEAFTVNSGLFETIFPTTALSYQNKILSGEGLTVVQNGLNSDVEFNIYSKAPPSTGNPLTYWYTKIWDAPTFDFPDTNTTVIEKRVPQNYISGDFNGDGLTDLLAIGEPYTTKTCYLCSDIIVNDKKVYFIDLNRNLTNNFSNFTGELFQELQEFDQIYPIDFNGDGKTDILHVANDNIYVYELDNNGDLQLIAQENNTGFNGANKIIIGDYNGDGKTDFMAPTANNSQSFKVFLSKGTDDFYVSTENMPFMYKNATWTTNGTLNTYDLIPLDINGDGKTDVIDYKSTTYNNSSNGTQTVDVYNNIGYYGTANPGDFNFSYGGSTSKTGNLKHYPIPIFLTSNQPNKNLDFASISNQWVSSFSFSQDHREDVLLKSIENNGVTYNISYGSLDSSSNSSSNLPIYYANWDAIYPYNNVGVAIGSKVVSNIERVVSGTETLKKEYAYEGIVMNKEGLGFCGFEGVAVSNWFVNNQDRIFTIKKFDPYLRGALTHQYSLPYFYSFFIPTTGYLSKTEYQYDYSLSASKVFKIWLETSLNQNELKGTYTNSTFHYDMYNNLETIYKNYSGEANTTTNYTYQNSTGTNYYIGRIVDKVETSVIGNDSFTTEQQFEYDGDLLREVKSKGNNTQFNISNFEYDNYGNVISNTFTPYDSPSRTVSYEYDSSGLFVEKFIDLEGLETSYSVNGITGTLTNITDPFGHITSYEYDYWYRPIKETDYLGNETIIDYEESVDHFYTVTSTNDDGSSSINVYDPLKRLSNSYTKNVFGDWVGVAYEYDEYDRLYKVSEPFIGISSSPTQWNETEFDFYGRPETQTLNTGRVISISYNGLTTTVNDGVKTVTTKLDAIGNVSEVTDPGGTIRYDYFGNGAIKRSVANEVVIVFEQDGWGRRTQMIDPSAGIYEYDYNGFGEIIKEVTPKGITEYEYTSTGRIIEKSIEGDNTEMNIGYTYDQTDKLVTHVEMTSSDGNNSSYSYEYDNYQRITDIIETNPYAEYRKRYSYDGFGRVETEASRATLYLNNKTSQIQVKNEYSNGYLELIRDIASNDIIWKLDDINARGQVTRAYVGNDMQLTNNYDTYGYLAERIVESNISNSPIELMNLNTDFDAQRGTLFGRSNSMFSWSEEFEYDDLDRLISFEDNNGDNHIDYDNLGRIIYDNTIGDFNYTSTSYQADTVDLNLQGDLYYQQNTLQQVTYNAFKKPVNINEINREKIDFQYNAFLGRSHMFYGNTEEDIDDRQKRKHYSFDGSMEISYDRISDKTVFVTYIGGDAYSAPAIWRSEQGSGQSVNEYYYLHRDYLGSILLITDEDGEAMEKRHFDAWGNIVKLTDGDGNTIDKLTFFDRGYTGHEHLSGVGLIHMNGRLYDPKLKRFLAPDNFIQDPFNTQNYNRYTYVLNNPLMYTDPTGETSENPSGLEQAGYANAIVSAAYTYSYLYDKYWDDIKSLRIDDWLDRNIGNWWDKNIGEPVKNFLDNIFGGGGDETYQIETPAIISQDPIVSSSSATSISFFGSGGSESSLGIIKSYTDSFVDSYKGTFSNLGNSISNFFSDPLGSIERAIDSHNNTSASAHIYNSLKQSAEHQFPAMGMVFDMVEAGYSENPAATLGGLHGQRSANTTIEVASYAAGGVIGRGLGVTARGSTTVFRSFTRSNFRTNLGRLTGNMPVNSQAHHVFPHKFVNEFSKRGINIHDPKFGTWWERTSHLQNARGYNTAWESFFRTNPNQSQIFNYGRQLMGQYGIPVLF